VIRKQAELPVQLSERMRGGKGAGKLQAFFKAEEFSTPLCAFTILTLDPGVSVGYHQHVGSEEVYWVLEGKGMARDDQESAELVPGDALLCREGHFHGIENPGPGPLRILTVMVNSKPKV
jgi:mannose-6-phosphate isomerase-like protein (cupin superfamily)